MTTENKLLRVGLLGTGVIAGGHAAALRSMPGVELVAVCDRDMRKAAQFQSQWKIERVFEDLDAMLSSCSLDVVHVLLPPSAHAEMALQCIRAKCHTFVEKPFCLSVVECQRVSEAAQNNGVTIGVNHNLTYMPGILKLIKAIEEYRLGAVEHVTMVYNLPMPALTAGQHGHWMFGDTGRLILELGPHPMSVIYRLLGGVQQASTLVSGKRILTNGKTFFDNWQSSLVCDRGTAQFFLSVGNDYLNTSVHVIGQDGECLVDLRRNTVTLSEKTKYLRFVNLEDAFKRSSSVMKDSVRNLSHYMRGALGFGPAYDLQAESMTASIHAFYEALLRGQRAPVGAPEATAVVHGCELISQSVSETASVGGR